MVEGKFTKEELRDLLQRVRDLERKGPDRVVMVFVDAPAYKEEEELLEVVRSIEPPMPYETVFKRLIREFGEFKRVVDAETGRAHKVPTRRIIEEGLKHEDLAEYPLWDE